MKRRYFLPLKATIPNDQGQDIPVRVLRDGTARPACYTVSPRGPWFRVKNPFLMSIIYDAVQKKYNEDIKSATTTATTRTFWGIKDFIVRLLRTLWSIVTLKVFR